MKVSASDAAAISQVLEIDAPLISPGDLESVPRGWFNWLGTLPLEQRRPDFINLLQQNYDGESAAILASIDQANPNLKAPRYTVQWAAASLQPQPPMAWIVKNLFSAGSVNLIVGEGGSKKTWAMLDCGVCVALGKPWLDFKTNPVPVLFIDEESGARRFMLRLGDVMRGHFANDTLPFAHVNLAQFDLSKEDDINEVHNLILQTGAKLVIIDALADMMPGADENAVKDVQPIFLALRGIADKTQSAIIVIHHMNKAGTYRGSTALKGACDLMLMVASRSESVNIDFKTEKARDIEPITFAAVAHFEDGQFWLAASDPRDKPKIFNKSQTYVLRFLRDNGESGTDVVKANADICSESAAIQALRNLASLNLTYRTNPGVMGRGVIATYALTAEGKTLAEPL